ncbi:MAG: GIY-YIG nuclease family protein [Salinivirgaceae bacterium]
MLVKRTKFNSEIFLYVLALQNGKYYVGITKNLRERFKKHSTGITCDFVKVNLPVEWYKVKLLKTSERSKALAIETKKTLKLIRKHGFENVYGGIITGDFKRRKNIYNKLSQKGFH